MIFSCYASVMDPKAVIYVFYPSSYQRQFEDAMNTAGIVARSQCIWLKNAASFGWSVFYAHLRGKSPVSSWYGDRKQTTIWKAGLLQELPEPERIWEVSRGDVTKCSSDTETTGALTDSDRE